MTERSNAPQDGSPATPPTPAARRTTRRREFRAALVALGIVALAVAFLVKTSTGRGWLISILSDRLETSAGLVLSVESTELSFWHGRVELHDVALRSTAHDHAFAIAEDVEVELRWGALLKRPIELDKVFAEEVRVDLGVLPPAGKSGQDASPFPLRVNDLQWAAGRIATLDGGDRFAAWFQTAEIGAIEGSGRLADGRLYVSRGSGVATLAHADRPTNEATLDYSATIALDGTIEQADLTLGGEGIQGELQFVAANPNTLNVSGQLVGALGRLFPDLTAAGSLTLAGDLEWTPEYVRGTGDLRVVQLPAVLLAPWISGPLADIELQSKQLEGEGTYRIDLPRQGESEGVVELDVAARLLRGSETLLSAQLRAGAGGADELPLRIEWDAALFPREPYGCRTRGAVALASWTDSSDALLEPSRFDFEIPDLGQAAERFGLIPQRVASLRPVGSLRLNARAQGPLTGPSVNGELEWKRAEGVVLSAAFKSSDLAALWAIEGQILPDEPGRRSWQASLIPDPSAGWSQPRFSIARLDLALPDPYGVGEQFRSIHSTLMPSEPSPAWVELLLAADPALGGALELHLEAAGAVLEPQVEATFSWQPGEDESLVVSASGTFPIETLEQSQLDQFDAKARNIRLSRLAVLLPGDWPERVRGGQFDATLEARGPVLRPDADLVVHGLGVDVDGIPALTRAAFSLSTTAEAWTLHDLLLDWADPAFGVLQASASAEPQLPLRKFSAHLVQLGLPRLGERAELNVEFEDGWLTIPDGILTTEGGGLGRFSGRVPLPPQWGLEMLASAEGPLTLEVRELDAGTIVAGWMREEGAPEIAGTLTGTFELDFERPAEASGQGHLNGFRFQLGEERVDAVGPLNFEFSSGTFRLLPGRLLAASSELAGRAPLDVACEIQLDTGWTFGLPFSELLLAGDAVVDGQIDASLLSPLIGASGTGPVELHLRGTGRPGGYEVTGTIRGETARFLFTDPYPTRIENFDARLHTDKGTIFIDEATAAINGGRGSVRGEIDLDRGVMLLGRFDAVRYRLGFGVTARLDADIRLDWPFTDRRLLSGQAVIQRALLKRDLNLDAEILRAIFDPVLETSTNLLLQTVDLDLSLLTDQGLVIRNNLAELHADWNKLEVHGTLADPLLSGVADVTPGGRLHLLGETLRIDEATLTWSSAPPGEPVLAVQTTSSRDDPTIAQSWRSGWYTNDLGPGQGGALGFWGAASATAESSFGSSLLNYTQDRLYGSLAEVLDRTQLSYEPLPLFGETDTEARFTLSQDLARNLSFVASTNPREAEGQTYILDLHEFRAIPSMRAQIFTGDNDTRGVTLQQTLILGDKGVTAGIDPRVRARSFELPETIPRRPIKRAIGFRKGDPFPAGAALDVEVDLSDAMRVAGYPDAFIDVGVEEVADKQIDLKIVIDPGPRVAVVFLGEELPRSVRRRLRGAYRSRDDETRSLEEMREVAAGALRATGCLEPNVSIGATRSAGDEPRKITVETACPRRVELAAPVLLGLPDDVALFAASGFASPLSRVDLATGVIEADDHLYRTLDALGYPQAQIVSRTLSADEARLELRVLPGPRSIVSAVELIGADEETVRRAPGLLAIRAGDPLRRDWISASERALQADLRSQGYDRATVRQQCEPDPDDPSRLIVRFLVDAGRPSRVDQVKIEGLRHSNPAWVANVAAISTERELLRTEIAEARGRLYRTGVFERIRVTTESLEEPATESDEGPVDMPVLDDTDAVRPVAVAFELDEAPRYQLSYGGRWQSDIGLGGVVDLVNRHTLGRGHRTGIRANLNNDLRSLRLYHVIPRPLRSSRSNLELFVEAKRETIENVEADVVEAWAQLTFPLSDRVLTRVYTAVGNRQILSGIPGPDIPLEEQVISPRFGWQLAYTTVQQGLTNQRRRGFFFGVDLSGSHAALGSDLTAWGLFTQFKVFAPFGSPERGRFSWHQSYRAGVLTAREQAIPFVDRLRAGGEFSVRGYSINSLGPLDIDGSSLGGELMFVLNQEFHARVWDALYGVVFFDAGNVWSTPQEFEFDLFKSAGVGARYTSPVGPLRLDIGFPLERRSADAGYKIYVGFGSVF